MVECFEEGHVLGEVVDFVIFEPTFVIERILSALAGLIFIAPSWQADLVALALLVPVVLLQLIGWRRAAPDPALG